MKLFDQSREQNLLVTFDAVVSSILMEVYSKCEHRHTICSNNSGISISCCLNRYFYRCFYYDIIGADLCIRCCVDTFSYFFCQRKMSNFYIRSAGCAKIICQLISCEGNRKLYCTFFRLILNFFCISFFIGLRSNKRNIVQKSIIFIIDRFAAIVVQRCHVCIIIVFTGSRSNFFNYKSCSIRNSTCF